MNKAIVSIIIPVYMSEEYLAYCLDSVVNQSVHDIEIICINDCSPDGSFEILKRYAENDARFQLVNFEENRGPGAARNAGLAIATGTYIRMVDSDDFIPTSSTEKLINAAEQHGSDFVWGGFDRCSRKGEILAGTGKRPEKLTVNTTIYEDKNLWNLGQHWAYLYKTSVLRATGAQYDESMRNGQDMAFIIEIMPYLENVTSVPEVVYYYRINPESTTRRKRDKTYFLNVLSKHTRAYEQLAKFNLKEVADYIFYVSFSSYLPRAILPSISRDLDSEDAKDVLLYLKSLIEKYNMQWLCHTHYYSWQSKIEIPMEAKYLILLLHNNYLNEAYRYLCSLNERPDIDTQIRRYRQKIGAIQGSTSWKLTAPLRLMADMIKRCKPDAGKQARRS